MEPQYWLSRWQDGRTGFHLDEVNPWLRKYWHQISAGAKSVLVPLCGKSLDLIWLRDQGVHAIGCELAKVAAEEFHRENRIDAEVREVANLQRYRSTLLDYYQGDFFALPQALDGKTVDRVYDRAALIALQPSQRPAYVEQLVSLLQPGGQILLINLSYDESRMSGPPFAIPDTELRTLFAGSCDMEELGRGNVIAENEKFAARGLKELWEVVLKLTKRD